MAPTTSHPKPRLLLPTLPRRHPIFRRRTGKKIVPSPLRGKKMVPSPLRQIAYSRYDDLAPAHVQTGDGENPTTTTKLDALLAVAFHMQHAYTGGSLAYGLDLLADSALAAGVAEMRVDPSVANRAESSKGKKPKSVQGKKPKIKTKILAKAASRRAVSTSPYGTRSRVKC